MKKKYLPVFLYFEKEIVVFGDKNFKPNMKNKYVVTALRLLLKKKVQKVFLRPKNKRRPQPKYIDFPFAILK